MSKVHYIQSSMLHNIKEKITSSYSIFDSVARIKDAWKKNWSFLGFPKQFWFRIILLSPIALIAYVLVLIITYTFFNPPLSSFMAQDLLAGKRISNQWVPIEKISRHMPVAVIMSEDNKFCDHYGVDWGAIQAAWNSSSKKPRGASTLTMQTVKNLFLWSNRDYFRKGVEVSLAHTVSLTWSKRRVMEIYLNIAEFGPGIYGVGAAAKYHFRKKASQLNKREAALLAAVLPNPIGRRAGRPGPKTRRIANRITHRMKAGRRYSTCIRP